MPLIGARSAGSKGYGMLVNASGPDPSFSSVSLLLHGDGTNGAQNNTFIDSSVNALTVLTVGNATQGTTSPFPLNGFAYNSTVNAGSGYFDGTSTTYLSIADSAAIQLGSGNFTIEFWCNLSNVSTGFLAGKGNELTQAGSQFSFYMPGTWDFYSGSTTYALTKPPLTANTWQHVAIIRNGTTITGYLNGASYASNSVAVGAATLNTGGATALKIGAYYTGGITGYISGFRITKNATVYTPPFSVPTSPLTAITDTSLLLNFTNGGVIDNASKNNLQTVNSAQITTTNKRFSIGSISFNGIADYLIINDNTGLKLNSTAFTIEAWIYRTADSTKYLQFICGKRLLVSPYTVSYWFGIKSDNRLEFYDNAVSVAGGTIPQNKWTHVAVSHTGSSASIYIDGSIVAGPIASTVSDVSTPFTIGDYPVDHPVFSGNIDDLRITKGVARYTANFTPSNAPFSNI
jgi:hypothetical protein